MIARTVLLLGFVCVCLVSGQQATKCTSINMYFSVMNDCTRGVTYPNNTNICGSYNQCNTSQQLNSYPYQQCLWIHHVQPCMEANYTSCTNGLAENVTSWFNQHKQELCDGSSPKASVLSVLPLMESVIDVNGSCFNGLTQDAKDKLNYDMNSCYLDTMTDALSGSQNLTDMTPYRGLTLYGRMYRNILLCMYDVYEHHLSSTCPDKIWEALVMYYKIMLPPGVNIPITAADLKKTKTPRFGPRTTLLVWGDPHYRVYNKSFVTCPDKGYKSYLRNSYVRIRANNSLVEGTTTEATIITELSIEFFSKGATIATYNASLGDGEIEAKFTNDKDSVTSGGATVKVARGVNLKNLVVITNEAAGIMIMIRKFKKFYPMLLVRMSNSVLDKSTGNFITGCEKPTNIRSGRRKRAADACSDQCDSMDEEFRDSCSYDCENIGDKDLVGLTGQINQYMSQMKAADDQFSDGGLDESGAAGLSTCFSLFLTSCLLLLVMI